MYTRTITENESGQRLDRYLSKLLPEAGSGFLHKMLRKKNIVLNDKKADGSEKLLAGDVVSVYFSDETLNKFMGTPQRSHTDTFVKKYKAVSGSASDGADSTENISNLIDKISVIYENEHILIADKPAGILSQKAEAADYSLNDWISQYMLENNMITTDTLKTFRPSVCNRLDRNTSGIVLCAKSVRGAQMIADLLKEKSIRKFYRMYVKGCVTEEKTIDGYLIKNEKTNKVQIYTSTQGSKNDTAAKTDIYNIDKNSTNANNTNANNSNIKGAYIKTRYMPIEQYADMTLLEVELITGKSHQIRAHLASIGHPILGDYKYGDRKWNEKYRNRYGVKYQLLHAYRVEFPHLDEPFGDISGREFISLLPDIFDKVTCT